MSAQSGGKTCAPGIATARNREPGTRLPDTALAGLPLSCEAMGTTYRMPILQTRREYFRLPYPISTGAVLAMEGASYKVDELSERGLRVVTGVGRFPVNSRIEGTLTLTASLDCLICMRSFVAVWRASEGLPLLNTKTKT